MQKDRFLEQLGFLEGDRLRAKMRKILFIGGIASGRVVAVFEDIADPEEDIMRTVYSTDTDSTAGFDEFESADDFTGRSHLEGVVYLRLQTADGTLVEVPEYDAQAPSYIDMKEATPLAPEEVAAITARNVASHNVA